MNEASRAAFNTLCVELRAARRSSATALQDFMGSERYLDLAAQMVPEDRKRLVPVVAALRGKIVAPFGGRVRWTEELIARLIEAEKRTEADDLQIAAELGVPLNAARMARYRFIGKRPGARKDRYGGQLPPLATTLAA